MTQTLNILVILALVTYASGYTAIPLTSHRVSRPVQRNLASVPNADIAITNVESLLYSGSIQIGTPPQNFSVIFDTGYADMIFFSKCPFCSSSINQYNFTTSNSSQDQLQDFPFTYYSSSNSQTGQVYEDYITVGGRFTVLGEFFVLNQPFGSLNTQYDGVVGLGFQNLTSGPLPTLLQLLQIANTNIPQMFSLHLTSEANQEGSSLIIGGYDILTAPNGFTFYNVSETLTWQLNIQDFGFNNKSYAETTGLYITLASGLPYIVAGGSIFNELLTLFNANTSCDNVANISSLYFNIEGDIYNVPAASLYTNQNQSGICTLNLQAAASGNFDDVSDNEILVGIPFLQNYYAMFDATNQQIGLTVPNSPQPPNPLPQAAGIVTISMIFTLFASFLYIF